jgi:hypothetical protein
MLFVSNREKKLGQEPTVAYLRQRRLRNLPKTLRFMLIRVSAAVKMTNCRERDTDCTGEKGRKVQ